MAFLDSVAASVEVQSASKCEKNEQLWQINFFKEIGSSFFVVRTDEALKQV